MAAFPFGFGLSYSRFHYDQLGLAQTRLHAAETLVASLVVTNDGPMDGDEVIQLYVAAIGSAVERPVKELKGFARVTVPAGETRTVRIEVPVVDLAIYDPAVGWTVEPIEYEAIVARHAEDVQPRRARFRVEASSPAR